MINLNLEQLTSTPLRSAQGDTFIALGRASENNEIDRASHNKIFAREGEAPRIWGTLGMADGSPINRLGGKLSISRDGSNASTADNSGAATLEEIRLFYAGREGEINEHPERRIVTERCVSFEGVKFKNYPHIINCWEDVPKLRLTLFLKQDEGALVYFQHRRNSEEGGIEYIQPLPTENHGCSERDRLTYHIPFFDRDTRIAVSQKKYPLPYVLQHPDDSPMLIKILVGKRKHSTTDDIIKRLQNRLFGDGYGLIRCNGNTFQPINDPLNFFSQLNNEPILLLIHGTFSSTKGAFTNLTKPLNGGPSWISRIADTGRYQEIICFDHPTIMDGPKDNVDYLVKQLPQGFQAPINILTHSRGALIGKYAGQYVPQFRINRGALVAGANGVGYLSAGWMVTKLLNTYRQFTPPDQTTFIAGIAQHSAEWFLSQPGPRAMTPGSDELKEILTRIPNPTSTPAYLPFVGDWERDPNQGWRGWVSAAIDVLAKPFLGWEHDWVVGSNKQDIYFPGDLPPTNDVPRGFPSNNRFPYMHIKYFDKADIQDNLFAYLNHRPV